MAKQTYDEALAAVLKFEGGYSNDAADPGGPTNFGITIFDARMYWKPDATAEDVKRMPLQTAKDIYRSKYWDALRCDDLPSGVDYAVFDYGVNSGISRSAKVLQKIVGAPVDGKIGLVTVTATLAKEANTTIDAIYDERLAFLKGLKTWPTFGRGWERRCVDGRKLCHDLATKYPNPTIAPPVINEAPAVPPPAIPPDGTGSAKAPEPPPEVKPLAKSKTMWGGVLSWLTGIGTTFASMFQYIATPWGFAAFISIILLLSVGAYLVFKGRIDVQAVVKKLSQDDTANA